MTLRPSAARWFELLTDREHLGRVALAGERGEEDPGVAQVTRQLDRGDGHLADTRILDLAAQQLRQQSLQLLADPARPGEFPGHGGIPAQSVRATSTRSKHSIWSPTRMSL